MHRYAVPFKRSLWNHNDEGSKFKYNPFRRRAKYSYSEQDIPSDDRDQVSPPPQKTLKRREIPSVVGHLFLPTERQLNLAGSNESWGVESALDDSPAENSGEVFDEEKLSKIWNSAESQSISPLLRVSIYISKLFATPKDVSKPRNTEKYKDGNRRRRVIVVEYGNTDNVTEGTPNDDLREQTSADYPLVTAETIRQSWNDPPYSEIAVPGYPINGKGHKKSRKSSLLSGPVKESLQNVSEIPFHFFYLELTV